jgi:glycine betaine/proline transport system substrate-binding protein
MGRIAILHLAVGVILAVPNASSAADVVIGVPNWSSAEVTAHVLKAVIGSEFEVDVELQAGSNEEIFAGMDGGHIHIHPEVWLPNHEGLSTEYVVRRNTVEMNSHGVPARQGLCVTSYTHDVLGITSVADLSDPERVAIFDTVGDGRGEIWIGASEWSSTRIERIRARSYGYEQTMQLLEAEEIVATVAIDAAVAVDKPLVFYCYEPHHVFELHEIVHLDEPPHDPRRWTIRDPSSDPEWLANSHADVAWPVSFFHIHYARRLAEDYPEIAAFLSAVRLDVDTVTEMTYAIVVERRDPSEFAAEWVGANAERVAAWREAAR